MKKKTLLTVTLFSVLTSGFSQKLLFTSEFGGDNSNGAIVSYDLNNNTTSNQLSLAGNPFYGYNIFREVAFGDPLYTGGLTLGSDGKYYGINTAAGGTRSSTLTPPKRPRGIFYSYDPATGNYEVLHSFIGHQEWHSTLLTKSDAFNNDLSHPVYTVLETSPGVFYGIALAGGVAYEGGIWKYDINTNQYSVIGSFKDPINDVGHNPVTALIKGDGNNIYGLCLNNSSNNSEGYLYKINTSTDVLSYVDDLLAAGWAMEHPYGQMVYNSSTNKIYGTKDLFSSTSSYGGGVWSYNLTTSTVTSEWGIFIGDVSVLGSNATGIVQGNDAKMYVTTRAGGANGTGTIIKYNPSDQSYLKVFDFPSGMTPVSGTGMIVSGSKIFGTCSYNSSDIQAWSYDYTNETFQTLFTGTESDPLSPGYHIEYGIINDNGNIIGTTRNGSEGGAGALFSHNLSSGLTSILQSHASREGRNIMGELTQLNDSTFIGYIGKGGPNTITGGASIALDEQGSLALFNVVSGSVQHLTSPATYGEDKYAQTQWMNSALLASNGKIYYSHASLSGATSNLQQLREHDLTNGSVPVKTYNCPEIIVTPAPIEIPNQKIVMAAVNNVYVYDLNTAVTTEFNNTHSYQQYGHMNDNIILASNGKIYGMTDASALGVGTGTNRSVIYSLDTINFTFQVEHVFDSLVRTTNSQLTEYNDKLYGSTNFLGANNQGHLFSYDMTTQAYTVEYSFDYDQDGGGFSAGWTIYNDKLYSTSRTGGANGYGTLVEFDLTNSTLNVLEHLTMENGRSFRGTPILWDDTVLGIGEIINNSNIQIFPNPARTVLNVELENVSLIEIYSTTGQLVKRIKNSNTINVEDISSGVLIIKVYNDKGIYSSRFIKE